MWAEATFFVTLALVVVLVVLLLEMRRRDNAMTQVFELLSIMDGQKQELDARISELTVDDEWRD